MSKNWYSLGNYKKIKCGNCNAEFSEHGFLDHHSGICPVCQIECIWYNLDTNKVIQIIPNFAPPEFKLFIRWAQKELDELEFDILLTTLEQLGKEYINSEKNE